MFFKNLILYRFREPFARTPEVLAEALARHPAGPCGSLEPFRDGWEPPLGRYGQALVHAANGRILICARREQRVLPAAVVRDALDERVAAIESQEFRSVGAKERRRLRDEVVFDLLPQAFTHRVLTRAYVCPQTRWLVVDAAAAPRAEDLVGLLARSLDRLDVTPYRPEGSAEGEMTRWLKSGRLPAGFELLHECELRDRDKDGGIVRCQRQDLRSDEVKAHLRARKEVHRLALRYHERMSFVLTSELALKRLRFEDAHELDAADAGDTAARLDADFAFMTTVLAPMLANLLELFGEGVAPRPAVVRRRDTP